MSAFTHAIFDFDGVVADTESVFADFDCALLNDVLALAGLEPSLTPAEVRKLAGNNEIKKLEIISQRLGFDPAPYAQAFKAERSEKRKTLFRDHKAPLGQGLEAFIARMDGRCALATNKVSAKLMHDMALMEIESLFDIIVACDPPMKKKPAPDMLLEAARRLSAQPEGCVYIGDNPLDMVAAKAANMEPIGFVIEGKDGQQDRVDALIENGASMVIDDFAALMACMEDAA